MRCIHRFAIWILAATAIAVDLSGAADDTISRRRIAAPETLSIEREQTPPDPVSQGQPLSYWLKMIRHRNEEMMPLAFEAIRSLGPEASPAVPELIRVIAAPFAPIRVGEDSDELIASKLNDIELRSEAVDALVWIGEAAAEAAIPLVRWALVVRVSASAPANHQDYESFIDLMTIDIEQRMLAVDAIVSFGDAATPAVERLLKTPDVETRKLAIVILGGDAVYIAAELLKSPDCEDRKLGMTLLKDMDLIVADQHLRGLLHTLACGAN